MRRGYPHLEPKAEKEREREERVKQSDPVQVQFQIGQEISPHSGALALPDSSLKQGEYANTKHSFIPPAYLTSRPG
jgi:hypothetical protein